MAADEMTKEQKAIQTADDLDEQASELNTYIGNSEHGKTQRKNAIEKQLALRRHAAEIRVNLVNEIVGAGAPVVNEVVAAAGRAKAAAKKIKKIKEAIDLASATITFFAALSTGQLAAIGPAWKSFTAAIDKTEKAPA